MLLCWSHTTPASILLDQPLHSCNCCSEWTLYTVPISCPSVKQLHAYTFLWRGSLWADPTHHIRFLLSVPCRVSDPHSPHLSQFLTHLVIPQSEWRTPTLCMGNDQVNVPIVPLSEPHTLSTLPLSNSHEVVSYVSEPASPELNGLIPEETLTLWKGMTSEADSLCHLFSLYSSLKQALLKRRHMLHVFLSSREQ